MLQFKLGILTEYLKSQWQIMVEVGLCPVYSPEIFKLCLWLWLVPIAMCELRQENQPAGAEEIKQ